LRFAWQGFSFEAPPDWQPLVLTGGFSAGYVRLSGLGRDLLQVRWQKSAGQPGRRAVESYLDRLARDAKKQGRNFEGKVFEDPEQVRYRYSSEVNGQGALFDGISGGESRTVFLEAASSGKSVPASLLKQALCSFRFEDGELTPWRLLGLEVSLPKNLSLQRKELMAGKTLLEFGSRGTLVTAERWGFAEQLLAKTTLTEWASALTGCKAVEEESANRVRLTKSRVLRAPVEVLAVKQIKQNQITLIRTETRAETMKPQWNWFD
jgi:hypothetical protein